MAAFWEEAEIVAAADETARSSDAPARGTSSTSSPTGADTGRWWEDAPIIAPADQGAGNDGIGDFWRDAPVISPPAEAGPVRDMAGQPAEAAHAFTGPDGLPAKVAPPNVTADDVASPIPTDLISQGRTTTEALIRGEPTPAASFMEALRSARMTEPGQDGAPAGALVNAMRGLSPEEAEAAWQRAQGLEEPTPATTRQPMGEAGSQQPQDQPQGMAPGTDQGAQPAAPSGPILRMDGRPFETASAAQLAVRARPDLKGRPLVPVRLETGGWGLQEQEGAPRQGDGIGRNLLAGMNEMVAPVLGLPADIGNAIGLPGALAAQALSRYVIDPLIGRERTDEQRAESLQGTMLRGGADDWRRWSGAAETEAATPGEEIARAAGRGIAGTVLPGAAARVAAGAGIGAGSAIAGPILETMAAPSVAANAAMGAAAGAGGQLAENALPEDAGPGAHALSRFAGEMVGGAVPAVAGPAMAAGGRAMVEGARRAVEPFTAAGQERMAARVLTDAASDPRAAAARLDEATEIVPGSAPTTAQASGDAGLLALERGVARRDPAPFLERQTEQETARNAAVERAAPTGRPEAVSEFLTRDVARIEAEADARFSDTLARFDADAQARRDSFDADAQARRGDITGRTAAAMEQRDAAAEAMGGTRPAPEIGAELRAELEAIKRDEKTALNRLYAAVDPGNTLVIDIAGIKAAAAGITRDLPKAAALTPTEARLHRALADMPQAERFSEIMALRSELTGAIREERALRGETPALRRMQQFRSAIEEAIGSGRQAEPDTAPAAALPPPDGTDRVFTPTGRPVDVNYAVVEADTLRPGSGQFQPRDRSRTASDLQIQNIAGNLQPERLARSPELGTGAPLTTRDGMVLDGNGRTAAVLRAYEMGGAQAQQYRAMVEREFPDAAGMKAPVMVRRPAGDLPETDLAAIAREANTGRGAAYSPAQAARIDADRLTDDVLTAYRGGPIDSPENAGFVQAFARSLPPEEWDSFITRGNTLSESGKRRLQAAAVERAYGGGLVERLFETGDEEIRALGRGLADAAPAIAQLRAAIARGEVSADMDPAQAVQDAVTVATRARRAGVPIGDVLSQADAFNPVHPLTPELLTAFYGPALSRISATRTTEALTSFTREAMQAGASGQMFRGATAAEIARGAARRTAGIDADAPPPAAPAGGGGVVRQELEPNFDAEAAVRYRGASSAYREFAARFKDGPTDRVLRAAKGGEGYQVADADVAARFFNAGKRAKEDVEAFARTIGDRERAAELLTEYAAASLRSAAMKSDGTTLDAQAHLKWLNRHADALRALDGLTGGKEARGRFLRIGEAQRLVNDLEAEAAELEKAATAAGKALTRDIEAERTAATRAATAERKATVAEAQAGAAARFLNGADPVRAVGTALNATDAPDAMAALVKRMKGDAEAVAGLRRAVVEHMNATLRGTAEVGDTGVTAWQPGRFNTFMRKHEAALSEVFEPEQLKNLKAVAEDLFRANRSAAGSRLPGGSDTAQNAAAIRRLPGKVSMLGRIVAGAGGAGSGAAVGGPAGALAGAVVTDLFLYGRSIGIERANEIITAAMLDPQLGARLLRRVSPKTENMLARDMIKRLEALGITSTPTLVPEADQDERRTGRGERPKESTSTRATAPARTATPPAGSPQPVTRQPNTPPAGQGRPAAGRGRLLSGGMRDGAQAGQPAGSGTPADPYRGTSRAEVDWFAANAPAGAMINIDGKLYRK